jgi:hypothetical protein
MLMQMFPFEVSLKPPMPMNRSSRENLTASIYVHNAIAPSIACARKKKKRNAERETGCRNKSRKKSKSVENGVRNRTNGEGGKREFGNRFDPLERNRKEARLL